MNYNKIYLALIDRANIRQYGKTKSILKKEIGYIERHHIVPVCMGGTDDKSNLVFLTAHEHFLAHLLLVRVYPDNDSLIIACQAMTMMGGNNKRTTGRIFKSVRERYAQIVSNRMKNVPKTQAHKDNLSLALAGKAKPHIKGDKNPMKDPAVVAKVMQARSGKLRVQKRDGIIFKFENIDTAEIFTGTRQQFREYAKLTSVDVYALVCRAQKTSKRWKLIDN